MIYENQLLQIGLKSEYRQNLGEQPLVKSRFKSTTSSCQTLKSRLSCFCLFCEALLSLLPDVDAPPRRSRVRVLREQDVHPVPQLLLLREQQRRAQVSYPFMTNLIILRQHSEPEHEEPPLQLCTTQKTTRGGAGEGWETLTS